jgi:hypothetical protein
MPPIRIPRKMLYRQGILKWTGWDVKHLWSPQFFRDPTGAMNHIEVQAVELAGETGQPEGGGI